jgi:hypothetical protein
MKLCGQTDRNGSEEYRQYLSKEYKRLQTLKTESGVVNGFEEVKLRLFLSLLERPARDDDTLQERRAVNE